jgi:hypothetical protein
LGLSWNFNGNFILSPKVSIGYLQNGLFENITLGYSFSTEKNMYPHYYVEGQLGKLTQPSDYKKMQVFYGGGIGLTIPTSSRESGVSLRASVFTGYLLFLNATFLFNNNIQTELGLQLVAPVPLKSIDFGPVGG